MISSRALLKPSILVVDDTPDNLHVMTELLRPTYRVRVANGGPKALQIAGSAEPPDLILLDIMMPGLNGYEVCRLLKGDPKTTAIPVIFLTAKVEQDDEERGLALGAVDYITKPISPAIVLARVKNYLALRAAADFLQDQNSFLEQEVARRTREVMAVQDVTILAMGSLAETRDLETGGHIRRTQHYVKALAMQLSGHAEFRSFLTAATIEMLFKSAPLHDIGKVGIPDSILLKPGRLTPAEFEVMKTHTTLGRDAIASAEAALGTEVAFLSLAKEIALSHQEKWDGSGYPQGLVGKNIPLAARLMAVADVYDALISRRVYKEPMDHQAAMETMIRGRGTHFDPEVIDALLLIEGEFRAIAGRFCSPSERLTGAVPVQAAPQAVLAPQWAGQ